MPTSNGSHPAKVIRRTCWFAASVVIGTLGVILFGQTRNQLTIKNELDVPVTIESVTTQLNDDEPKSALSTSAGVPFGKQTVASGQSFRSSFRGQPHARLRITYHIDDGPTFYHEYGTIRTWGFQILMAFERNPAPQLTVTTSSLRGWIESHRNWLPSNGSWFD